VRAGQRRLCSRHFGRPTDGWGSLAGLREQPLAGSTGESAAADGRARQFQRATEHRCGAVSYCRIVATERDRLAAKPLCHHLPMNAPDGLRLVRGACPHDCPDTCALQVTVQAGRVVRVAGDAEHPPTHGALCTKVSRYAERTHHPDRVLQPLKRVGPKGSGRFEPVAWDVALADIALRLKRIAERDPQAIVPA
jgi:anaerobic selenocysteine-containing dehydrogenase